VEHKRKKQSDPKKMPFEMDRGDPNFYWAIWISCVDGTAIPKKSSKSCPFWIITKIPFCQYVESWVWITDLAKATTKTFICV